jgi:hypothetical protein
MDVGPDDRAVVFDWLGAAPEFEQYRSAEVVESPGAVALVAVGVDIGRAGWRTLAGLRHRVPAVLSEPLGSRVFVDLHGNAAQAIRAPRPS